MRGGASAGAGRALLLALVAAGGLAGCAAQRPTTSPQGAAPAPFVTVGGGVATAPAVAVPGAAATAPEIASRHGAATAWGGDRPGDPVGRAAAGGVLRAAPTAPAPDRPFSGQAPSPLSSGPAPFFPPPRPNSYFYR